MPDWIGMLGSARLPSNATDVHEQNMQNPVKSRMPPRQEYEALFAWIETCYGAPNVPLREFWRFLNLPPELRNLIYEDVAQDATVVLQPLGSHWHETWPAICFVSRQLRDEVLPVFYKHAAFEVHVRDMDFSNLISFSTSSSPACRKALLSNDTLTALIYGFSGSDTAIKSLLHGTHHCARRSRTET